MRWALLAVVALAALLLSMAAMHASMVGDHGSGGQGHGSSMSAASTPPAMASQVDGGDSKARAMGDMHLADRLLLCMVCFLTAVAVLLLAVVIGHLRSLLRPRAAARSLAVILRRLRPPTPPSLLALSISRT